MKSKTKHSAKSKKPSDRLVAHLRRLGLRDTEAYQHWCKENGFGLGLNKPKKMFAREVRHEESVKEQEQSQRRRRDVPIRKLVVEVAKGSVIPESASVVQSFSSLATRIFGQPGRKSSERKRRSLVRLVEHLVAVRCKFVDSSHCDSSLVDGCDSMLESLVWIAANSGRWIRPLEQWKPRTRNARRQFRSLLRHLFDRYGEVPEFMDLAWAMNSGDCQGDRYRRWYLHLGKGSSAKELDFPVAMNKAMLREFLRAPKDESIPRAIRWAQVVGMGGSTGLAEAVLGSRLSEDFRNDDFWVTVLRWFVEQPLLDTVHVAPIIDYLHERRFVPEYQFGPGDNEMVPPEPNLTMRGRTTTSLLRQVGRWHRRLAKSNQFQVQNWKSTGIRGLEIPEGKETSPNFRVWTIRELLGSKALAIEGRQLNHCVASYAGSCVSGTASIWTLEVESYGGLDKRITIEVHPRTKTIVQARGKRNRNMTEQERGIVRRWCSVAGLKIGSHV